MKLPKIPTRPWSTLVFGFAAGTIFGALFITWFGFRRSCMLRLILIPPVRWWQPKLRSQPANREYRRLRSDIWSSSWTAVSIVGLVFQSSSPILSGKLTDRQTEILERREILPDDITLPPSRDTRRLKTIWRSFPISTLILIQRAPPDSAASREATIPTIWLCRSGDNVCGNYPKPPNQIIVPKNCVILKPGRVFIGE